MMEPPPKRQRISRDQSSPSPTRTLNLQAFERPQSLKRSPERVILPRMPDVTVTAAVLEVAVNDGATATQISIPSSDVAVTLNSLGTVTLPGLLTSSSTIPSSHSGSLSSLRTSNSTLSSTTDVTVTITATSTFHLSYTNGTFIAPTATRKNGSVHTKSNSGGNIITDSGLSSTYTFGQDVSDTYSPFTQPTAGVYNGGAVPATNTLSGASPSSSSNDGGGGSGGPVLTTQQTQMVGGIVGGVAGIALVLIVLLYVLRWYRQRLKSQGRLPEQLSSKNSRDFADTGLISSAAPMSQSSRSLVFPGAVMASSLKKFRPGSDMTSFTNTTSTSAADSEKGFHRVSGRKIPSVLSTGGDQFGGSYGAFEKDAQVQSRPTPVPFNTREHDLSETSFYRDEAGTYISDGRPVSRSAPTSPMYPSGFAGINQARRPSLANIASRRDFPDYNDPFGHASRPDGVAIFRSSPARTPVTQSPNISSIKLPIQAPLTMDTDIPEMPLPSPGAGLGMSRKASGQRVPSRVSTRASGRFREELH